MKQYDVTVTVVLGPETLSVLARDEDEAKHKAVWMIGLAGFKQAAAFEVKYAPYGVAI